MEITITKNGKKQKVKLPDARHQMNQVFGNKIFSVNSVSPLLITKDDRRMLLADIQDLVAIMTSQVTALKEAYEK